VLFVETKMRVGAKKLKRDTVNREDLVVKREKEKILPGYKKEEVGNRAGFTYII